MLAQLSRRACPKELQQVFLAACLPWEMEEIDILKYIHI